MEMTERVNELILVCERMIDILRKENDALETQNPKKLAETLEEKDKLSRLYERHTRGMQREASKLQDVDEHLRKTLKELSTEMDELVERNARMLKQNIDLNRRVLLRFADAAKKLTPHSGTYSGDAHIGARGENVAPISLNKTL